MTTQITRAQYVAPRLEVQRLRELPSALASSGKGCHISKNGISCSVSGTGGRTGH